MRLTSHFFTAAAGLRFCLDFVSVLRYNVFDIKKKNARRSCERGNVLKRVKNDRKILLEP